MKRTLLVGVTTVVALSSAIGADARDCSALESMDTWSLLSRMIGDSSKCRTETGFDVHNPPHLPPTDMHKRMCDVPQCGNYMQSIRDLKVPDCTMTMRPNQIKVNLRAFANDYEATCASFKEDPNRLCSALESMDTWGLLARAIGDSSRCKSKTGYDLHQYPGEPTDKQLVAMCAEPSCHDYMERVQELEVPNCKLTIRPDPFYVNIRNVANTFKATCATIKPKPTITFAPTDEPNPTTTPAPPTPSPTPKPTASPTPTPAPTKEDPTRICEGLEAMDGWYALAQSIWYSSQCRIKTGYDLHKYPGEPTREQLKDMCGTPICHEYMVNVIKYNVPNCKLTVRRQPPRTFYVNIRHVANTFNETCQALKTEEPTPAPIPAPTPAPTPEPSTAPVPEDPSRICEGLEAMDGWYALAQSIWYSSQCRIKTGYDLHKYPGEPTREQLKDMCGTPICHEYMVNVIKYNVPNCKLTVRRQPPRTFYVNIRHVANTFNETCAAIAAGGSLIKVPSLSPAPSSTAEATPAPTVAC